MAYEAPKVNFNFESPRKRNLALYSFILASSGIIDLMFIRSPVLTAGVALIVYAILFDAINPDRFFFKKNGTLIDKVPKKNLIVKPFIQPFKDIINLVRPKKPSRA